MSDQAAASGARRASPQEERIQLEGPAMAPMAYARFCLEYREECAIRRLQSAAGLTRARWAELTKINIEVNRAIAPQPNEEGLQAERWLVAPQAGDCHDYAVTKRHELLARGWPSRALLLAEVVTAWGEHHLVLVIRTRDGDFVADNLNANIRPWYATRYRWVRMQSPQNPMFWSAVAETTTIAPSPALAYSGHNASDILVAADETEVAMTAADPASAPVARAAPASESLEEASTPAVASASFDLAGDVVDETQHGFGAAARIAAFNIGTPFVTAEAATHAVVRFGFAASELWQRQFARLLSLSGFSTVA